MPALSQASVSIGSDPHVARAALQRVRTSSVRSKLRRRVRQATAAAPQKADADRGDLVSISNFTRRSDYLLTDREAIAAISQ
jgi:hypothetical protein